MHIIDVPVRLLLPAPSAPRLSALPAIPHGELDSLLNNRLPDNDRVPHISQPLANVGLWPRRETRNEEPETGPSCQYPGRPCPRPVVHYADKEEPEEYCAAHLAWIEQVEEKFDVPYPDSPQALLDLLAHATGQVLAGKMIGARALLIIQLVRAMERQLRWM